MVRIAKAFAALPDTAALAVALACLLAAIAAQGGRFSPRLDVLTHFAPVWGLGAAISLGYGLVFASPALRLAVVGTSLAALLAAAALILPELTRPIRPDVGVGAPHQIKLIQFNAWDANLDVEATADWIAAQAPDLVLMEEVEAPTRQAMIRRGFHYQRGWIRSAIFSRVAPEPTPFPIPARDWPLLPDIARATFPDGEGGFFSVASVHLDWPTRRDQSVQIKALSEIMDRYPTNGLILTGDFNLTPWSFTLRRLDQRLGLERRDRALFSWPARGFPVGRGAWPLPFLPIDHLYAGQSWRTVAITRGPRLGSDHYPVVIRLALTD